MVDGTVKGFFRHGREPDRRRRPTAAAAGRAWRNLDWLVVRDLVEIETRRPSGRTRPRSRPARSRRRTSRTEVFFLPGGRAHREERHLHQHPAPAAVAPHRPSSPRGDARSELWFVYHLGRRIREKLAGSSDPMRPTGPRPGVGLPDGGSAGRARRRCGAGGDQRRRNARASRCRPTPQLTDDGSTSVRVLDLLRRATPMGSTRPPAAGPASEQDWVAAEWGWAWPANRRILYNRASADPEGKPWSERKALRLVGPGRRGNGWVTTCPTSTPTRPPTSNRSRARAGPDGAQRRRAVHHAGRRQGVAVTRRPALVDGPLPAHYEPQESPVANPLYARSAQPGPSAHRRGRRPQRLSPEWRRARAPRSSRTCSPPTASPSTTPRAGCRRWLPYLAELQPEMFCEVSPGARAGARPRARRLGDHRDGAGAIEARVLVTERVPPITGRRPTDPSGRAALPLGRNGYSVGDAANELAHLSLDPNVHIQEVKAQTCDVRAGRKPRGRGAGRAGARLPAARRHHVRHRPRGLTVEPPALRLDCVARVPGGLAPGLEDGEAGARRTGQQRQAGDARAAGGVVRPRARRPPRPVAAPTTPGGSGLPAPCGRRHRPTPSGAPSAR